MTKYTTFPSCHLPMTPNEPPS